MGTATSSPSKAYCGGDARRSGARHCIAEESRAAQARETAAQQRNRARLSAKEARATQATGTAAQQRHRVRCTAEEASRVRIRFPLASATRSDCYTRPHAASD
jgi:hypothetical protein